MIADAVAATIIFRVSSKLIKAKSAVLPLINVYANRFTIEIDGVDDLVLVRQNGVSQL